MGVLGCGGGVVQCAGDCVGVWSSVLVTVWGCGAVCW
jgi:hypothetical protein